MSNYSSIPHSSPGRLPQNFNRLQATRQQQNMPPLQVGEQELDQDQPSPVSSLSISPIPPPHRDARGRHWPQDPIQRYSTRTTQSVTTPGADNFSEEAAAGGIAKVALGVAAANARESGIEAMRRIQNPDFDQRGVELQQYSDTMPYRRPYLEESSSQSSIMPLGGTAAQSIASPAQSQSYLSAYSDNPFNRHSHNFEYEIDPSTIEDDGDDGLEYPSNRESRRGSTLSLGHPSNADRAAGMSGATAGLMGGAVGTSHLRDGQASSEYAPVPPNEIANGIMANPRSTMADMEWPAEKEKWLQKERRDNKKRMWIVIAVITLLIIGGVLIGVLVGVLGSDHHGSSSSSNSQSASNDQTENGNLTRNSAQIQALLNNPDLHKVFPGIDYTPINTQYPDCLTSPPSQNNVTRDLAVLSQLTNVIRLYGTDCNQTEMLLHAVDALNLNDTIKVWLGVWQSTNLTTNARQLDQMYTILDNYGTSPFEGIIIGNEVLFREDMNATQLGDLITDVRTNLTAKGITLPLATSDLGDALSKEPALAETVDYVMSNIHPFFAGVEADVAAAWTVNFWNEFDVPLSTMASNKPKNIISETGWPSAGGMDCGAAKSCTNGSVAGISEMNTFLDTFVCQALANGTTFFWFEAFDEPWKIIYDTKDENWEDKWGLMDVNRNLKKGVVVPDCNGATVDS